MLLKDVPVDSYVTRTWLRRNNKNKLRIHVYQLDKTTSIRYEYIDTCAGYGIVHTNSTAWNYDDYVFCDKDGNILENQPQKEQLMATCYSAKIIVATNNKDYFDGFRYFDFEKEKYGYFAPIAYLDLPNDLKRKGVIVTNIPNNIKYHIFRCFPFFLKN